MALDPNLHSVWCSERPLCVMCRRCLHRALLSHEQIGAFQGNMKRLKDLKLVCSKCSSRSVVTKIAITDADIKRFMDEYRR